ncbi:MAG: hypothetical protein QF616_09930, partial [Candidatus Marinimicrobia bacterium]|nr:hypothetical protein [Candidatus Neomarinimicrobiota bacterium]
MSKSRREIELRNKEIMRKRKEELDKHGITDEVIRTKYIYGRITLEEAIELVMKDGIHIERYENGNKKSEGTLKDGELDGLWTYWDKSNGKEYKGKVEVGFEDGGVIGTMIYNGGGFEWYPNNEIKSYNSYKNGTLDGLITRWYDNGQKKVEGNYKDGKEDGIWIAWD